MIAINTNSSTHILLFPGITPISLSLAFWDFLLHFLEMLELSFL